MKNAFFDLPRYHDYISPRLARFILDQAVPVPGVAGLKQVGPSSGLEQQAAFAFMLEIYGQVRGELRTVLDRRLTDRMFIDQRVRSCHDYNQRFGLAFAAADHQGLPGAAAKNIFGMEDAAGRMVIGPLTDLYAQKGGKAVAPIPDFLQGPHVTLFGPPTSAKTAINAMNAYHCQMPDEPKVVNDLLKNSTQTVKWGADCEDSLTPLRSDLVEAGVRLGHCLERSLTCHDPQSNTEHSLASEHLAIPIKRFPGLAIPATFLFFEQSPLPLHLYDFALHVFRHWQNPKALTFYVPKLENEEEARYIHKMVSTAEALLKKCHPDYQLGSIRLLVVLENPRAIFRLHEIMDALHPYFVGASLGWHDLLASTARIFKEDAHYRIPVKADPSIVIRHIKESHLLLADVVGSRGGIKIGGMYGILPLDQARNSASYQVALKGYFKDVITQLRRGLDGFWVAYPDFVRPGLALVEAWHLFQNGSGAALTSLVTALLQDSHAQEILRLIHTPDAAGLSRSDPRYMRSLLVSDLSESNVIANNHPSEVRYNVFQSLQYLADWLGGNGCVALPAVLEHLPVQVMDDLATAERSRWEVWHEVYHRRFAPADLLKIAHEELAFIRKDGAGAGKMVQVKWDIRTAKWYPVSLNIMLKLMTSPKPVEFATEFLLAFTIEAIRSAADPWRAACDLDPDKYECEPWLNRANRFFTACGCLRFAQTMADDCVFDLAHAERVIGSFSLDEIREAASFHGDIGAAKSTLDHLASAEQALVIEADVVVQQQLLALGQQYAATFGIKFLVSAQGKTSKELHEILSARLKRSPSEEVAAAKEALWQIARKRLLADPLDHLNTRMQDIVNRHQVVGAAVALTCGQQIQALSIGSAQKGKAPVTHSTLFEIASLSKTIASVFALEFFRHRAVPLATSVNTLFAKTLSPFRLQSSINPDWAERVSIRDLLAHTALNMHYVGGFPAGHAMPSIADLLMRPQDYAFPAVDVISEPGTAFKYSGAGFLVLEHLIEALEQKSIQNLILPFLVGLGLSHLSFDQRTLAGHDYAHGHFDDGMEVPGTRLMFPAFAAGAMGSAVDVLGFLQKLGGAFANIDGHSFISHDTAVEVLHGRDCGAVDFMGCQMGLGVFTAEAGLNRLAVHQGANEGFRALYVYCFAGPDCGKGFVILCNSDNQAVACIAELTEELLRHLSVSGVDFSQFGSSLTTGALRQEEIINVNYRDLIFRAFQPTLPEEIRDKGPLDPLAPLNILRMATIVRVSNQRFGRAENLLSDHLPRFDPDLFGHQGKIMDSWETARHNQAARSVQDAGDYCDYLELDLRRPSPIAFVAVSTQFHDGNQAESVCILGKDQEDGSWQEVLPRTKMLGHAQLRVQLGARTAPYRYIRVQMYPDGGLSRLGLYSELSAEVRSDFEPLATATCRRFRDEIPKSRKPLTIPYKPGAAEIAANLTHCKGQAIDYACAAFGGHVVRSSNEHYGPAAQVISPYSPLHMYDGLESSRSRVSGHTEELVLKLAMPILIERMVMDFGFFINNNPLFVAVTAGHLGAWVELIEKCPVKAYAGNIKAWEFTEPVPADELKIVIYPDGGINRIHVYGKPFSQDGKS